MDADSKAKPKNLTADDTDGNDFQELVAISTIRVISGEIFLQQLQFMRSTHLLARSIHGRR
jgi:hypothetical protein